MKLDLERRGNTLAQWIFEAKYLVVFTGAGTSMHAYVAYKNGFIVIYWGKN